MGKIKIMVADDQLVIREGYVSILKNVSEFEVVPCDSETINGVVSEISELNRVNSLPNILLVDLNWHGDEDAGIELIKIISARYGSIKIMAVSNYPNLLSSARIAGAHDCLNKNFSRTQFIKAINEVFEGKTIPFLNLHKTDYGLTAREFQIIALMDQPDKEIAERLGISVFMTKSSVATILSKLHCQNRTQVVKKAIEENLISQSRS